VDPALKIPQKTRMVANERPCESSGNALVAIATGARYLLPEMPCKSRGKALVAIATGARYREPETPCESRGKALVANAGWEAPKFSQTSYGLKTHEVSTRSSPHPLPQDRQHISA